MSTSTHWRIPPDANLIWRRWPGEDEYVFYHSATGDTHRLSGLAGLVVEEILAGRGDSVVLMRWLREHGDEAPEATLAHVVAGLAQLEFIEPDDASG